MEAKTNYLENELYERMRTDNELFGFLLQGSLDGAWYRDIEHPEQEWINNRFWELLGFDPSEKKHLASEWQDLIFPEDLEVAMKNFKLHCADPDHPYDQVVRFRHKDGSTVWVRCRGIAIRDGSGKPIRMLGTDTDLSDLMQIKEALAQQHAKLQKKADELERMNALMIGRERRLMELKAEVNELLAEVGRPAKYNIYRTHPSGKE